MTPRWIIALLALLPMTAVTGAKAQQQSQRSYIGFDRNDYPGEANLAALRKAGIPVLAYGNFLTIALNFAILAFVIFVMVKQINRIKRETPAAPAAPAVTPEDIVLLREIRDSLKK